MDEDTIPLRSDFLEDFYKSSGKVKNPGTQRQAARHTASHVDFRVNADIGRIRNGENSRRKPRAKCCHCEFSYCQASQENNSIDANRKSDRFSRKNSDKSEATLSQHFECGKNASLPINSRRPSGSSQQCNQTHRPGTSVVHCHNRSNRSTFGLHHHSQKSEHFCHCERSEHDSPIRENVNSDVEKDETDYRLSHEQIHSRNVCKHLESFWRFGEPHSKPETDLSPNSRRQDWLDSKKRKTGQGESIEGTGFEGDGKALVETGSSVVKDDWQQYERDQRELKDLSEDLRQFVEHKMSSGQVVEEKKQRDEMSSDTLEKINRFVSKLPVPGQKNSRTKISSESQKNRTPRPKMRIRTSKIDARKTYHSGKIEERLGEEREDRELGEKLEDDLLDIQLESSKLDDDDEEAETYEEGEEGARERRSKEDEAASETEEEARQLLKEETDIEHLKRRLQKSWTGMLREGPGNSRDMRKIERLEEDENSREKHKKDRNLRHTRKEKKHEKSEIFYKGIEIPGNVEKQNHSDTTVTRRDDFKNDIEPWERLNSRKNRTCRDETTERDGTREKLYERANSLRNVPKKYCNGPPPEHGGKHDIELNTNKTKASIDEMINDGLCREAKRVNAAGLPLTKKELLDEEDETSRGYSKDSVNSNVPTKIMRDEDLSHTMTRRREIFPITSRINHDLSRIKRDDCFCRRIGKTLADNPSPEYVRELKNRRWYYLDNIRNVLAKLYDLEGLLDLYSPGREAYTSKNEMNPDLTS